MKRMRLLLSVLTALCITASLLSAAMNVGAVSYSGSGTKASPYLVTNAEQLQGMRDNLSAHYRLANTIDLNGVDFKPVGRLDQPFTGSFSCELNSDQTPKYIIKNLHITVAETPYSAENKNKWEAGLFGAVKGAVISGIYVLDANIINENLGDNTGAVQYGDYKPGMGEMSAGILIGFATNTTITNCASSGTVGGRASYCGGLIGSMTGGTVKNSYSTANVETLGKWSVGGLIGKVSNSNVISCYSTGNVKGGQSSIASFIGACSASNVTDCYSTGNATGIKEDCTNFTTLRGSEGTKITNCFATGSIAASVKKNNEGTNTITNCYTLSGKLSDMTGFTSATAETIKGAIKGDNWDSSGDLPTLKNIVVVNPADYNPGTGEASAAEGGNTANTTSGQTTVTVSEGGGISEQEGTSVEEVIKLIEALPDPEEENSISLDDKDAVKEAWAAYEALSAGEKDDFDAEAAAKLIRVHKKLSMLMAADIVTRIEKLPDVKDLKPDDIDEIMSIWEDYEFIDDDIKAEIDKDYIDKLEQAHEYAVENSDSETANVTVDESFSTLQKVVIGICILLVVLGVAFNVFSGIMYYKRSRKCKDKDMLLEDELHRE